MQERGKIFLLLKKERIGKSKRVSEAFRRLIKQPVAKLDVYVEGGS